MTDQPTERWMPYGTRCEAYRPLYEAPCGAWANRWVLDPDTRRGRAVCHMHGHDLPECEGP